MENLCIYNKVKTPPKNALKPITGGRLINKTDINPMWRIRTLTEQFGPCGIGWYPVITKKWLEKADNGEVAAFVDIELFIKVDGEWSKPIPGTGGSMLAANEKSGPYVCDDCYKMAYTDAISVACKALGIAADVYWANNETKYDAPGEKSDDKNKADSKVAKIGTVKIKELRDMLKKTNTDEKMLMKYFTVEGDDINNVTMSIFDAQMASLIRKLGKMSPDTSGQTKNPFKPKEGAKDETAGQ
ncbi:MAG: hypothetical protein WC373_15980 [Smithella sp.]|jgi:hypothetical protein